MKNKKLNYIKKISEKGNVFYDVHFNSEKIGMVEYHKISNNYIEIDRIYLNKDKQKQKLGQKIIIDILNKTKTNGFTLYPLQESVWLKLGLTFLENKYPYMTTSKIDFIKNNNGI